MSSASKSIETVGDSVSLSDAVINGHARIGFDLALRPDWNLRLIGEGRFGFGSAELDNEDDLPGVTLDGGSLNHGLAGLFASHTF
jgi:hypothetical protein